MLTAAGTIGRGAYLRTGLGLMALKYAVDAALIYLWDGTTWTPIDYVRSLASLRGGKAAAFPPALSLGLVLWTLPFMWVGVMLSVRRARDAGLSLWLVVLFFVPAVNYVLMAALAMWPSEGIDDAPVPVVSPAVEDDRAWWRGLIAGVSAGVIAGVVFVVVGTMGLRTYGLGVFVATPFVIGLVSAYVAKRLNPQSDRPLTVLLWTIAVLAGAVVVLALEGIVCVLMAAPLVIPLVVLGGLVGHYFARTHRRTATVGVIFLTLGSGQAVDATVHAAPARVVLTSIEIAAPPARVWQHVVSFADITSPPAWYFRAGLSYPLRARIEGRGVGAVRYCEFTTGAFREPITAWDEPVRLAFDVTDQPAPLREWSPYRHVYAPHLDGFFRTTKGEFRLVPLPDGRTRLEGRTWYSLRMRPQTYWTTIADAILHKIHLRVLEHIRASSERN